MDALSNPLPNDKPKDYTIIIFPKSPKFRQLYANPLPCLPLHAGMPRVDTRRR